MGEPVPMQVNARIQNVKPLLGLYKWSFVDTTAQKEFWNSLWTTPEFNKACKVRKANPEGSAWMILRGLGYTNVGRQESYHNEEHLEFEWSKISCIQNTYKNSKMVEGVKAKLSDELKSIIKTESKCPVEIRPSLISKLNSRQKTNFLTKSEEFNADAFLVSIFPFVPPHEARWQAGRRKQLEVFTKLLCEFIIADRIYITAADDDLS